jgi:hypothetical protein
MPVARIVDMPSSIPPRSRYATWVAALALVAGIHVGVLAHQVLQTALEDEPSTVVVASVTNEAPTIVLERAGPERAELQLAHCRSEHVCVIDRDALADAFARRDARLLRSVRAEPGEGGLVLSGVRRHGLLGVVGLRNGDVLTSVDGHPLTSGADVEVLLQRAQQGSFRLAFRRDDRMHVKRFELIDGAAFRTSARPA